MAGSSRATLKSANLATAIPCDTSRKGLRAIDAIRLVAKEEFETKRAANLAARAGCKPRMCDYWLAGKFDIGGDALANLLRSDIGFKILERLMGGAKPDWWQQVKRAQGLGAARQQAAQLSKLIAQLELEV